MNYGRLFHLYKNYFSGCLFSKKEFSGLCGAMKRLEIKYEVDLSVLTESLFATMKKHNLPRNMQLLLGILNGVAPLYIEKGYGLDNAWVEDEVKKYISKFGG
jgi:hypothetical protein